MIARCFSGNKLQICRIPSKPKLRKMAVNLAPVPTPLALVDLHPERGKLTIQFTLGGKRRVMERDVSEQLKSCLTRIQLNQIEKKDRKKKGQENIPSQSLPTADLLFQSQPVPSELTHLEAWRDGSVLRVGAEEFLVRYNTPRVLSLSLPRHTFVGCPVVPRVELSHCEPKHCRWVWGRVQDPAFSEETFSSALSYDVTELSEEMLDAFNIVRLSEKSVFSPQPADVGHKLLLLVLPSHPETGLPGICCHCSTVSEVRPAPALEGQVDRFVGTRQPTDAHHVRVMSYNILADMWTNSKECQEATYPYCSPLTLDVEYRQALTNRELLSFSPDIACLQEVTKNRYTNYLMPAMECSGFSGHFASKAGEMPEGEVTLFRRDRFDPVDMYSLHSGEYMKIPENLDLYNSLLLWGQDVLYRFLTLGTIFQICILKERVFPDKIYIVANTHLYFRSSVPYMRLFQMALLVRHLERLVKQYKESEGRQVSVLLCGDFNSTPNTGLIEYLQTGLVQANNVDWQQWELGVATEFKFPGISLSHSLQLFNACPCIPFTHFAGHYSGTLDYIFCDSDTLCTRNVAPMPSLWEVNKETALPNSWFPSDHVPIVCDLKTKRK